MGNNKPLLLFFGLIMAGTCGWLLIQHQGSSDTENSTIPSTELAHERFRDSNQQKIPRRASVDSRRAEFESTSDLFGFANALAKEYPTSDPEALWFIRRAKEYCAGFSSNPDKYASDTTLLKNLANATSSQSLKWARDRVAARCAGFSYQAYGVADDIRALEQAAKAGSIPAEAALLTMRRPVDKSAEYKTDLVRRILESRDPEAFLAISESMSTPIDGSNLSGDQNAVFAWQIAACDRGLNCQSTGSLMTSYCANGGVCGNYKSFNDLVFNGMAARSDLPRIEFYLKQIQQAGDFQ